MQILKKHEFKRKVAIRKSKYPWDEWFDGKIRHAESEVDFKCATRSFVQHLYDKARKSGIRLRLNVQDDGSVIFQAIMNGQA